MADPFPPQTAERVHRTAVGADLNGVFVEIIRLIVVLLATAGGFSLGRHGSATGSSVIIGAVLGASFGYVGGGLLGRQLSSTRGRVELRVQQVPAAELLAGAFGGVALGAVALLAGLPLALIVPGRWAWTGVAMTVWFGIAEGARLGLRRSGELMALVGVRPVSPADPMGVAVALVDAGAIVDGRLLPIVSAGFLGRTLLVPQFVIDELQAVADNPDPARSRRGRRGLETLDALRRLPGHGVRVLDDQVPEHEEIGAKLLTLARRLDADLVTVDGPFERVAELQGVQCLNLERLAEGLRPLHIPGEVFDLPVVRAGREPGQGVGFLDDGTMVVVSGAAGMIGREVPVQVTSGTQTSMGRMLFASLADGGERGHR